MGDWKTFLEMEGASEKKPESASEKKPESASEKKPEPTPDPGRAALDAAKSAYEAARELYERAKKEFYTRPKGKDHGEKEKPVPEPAGDGGGKDG